MKRLKIEKYPTKMLSIDGKTWIRGVSVLEQDWRKIMRVVNVARKWREAKEIIWVIEADLVKAVDALEGKK